MKFHEYKTLWEEVWGTLPQHVTEEISGNIHRRLEGPT